MSVGRDELVTLDAHSLTLTLPGGTGDIFKYNTAPFVGVPRCGDPDYQHYLPTDINRDCLIDSMDLWEFAGQWLDCTDPDPPCLY